MNDGLDLHYTTFDPDFHQCFVRNIRYFTIIIRHLRSDGVFLDTVDKYVKIVCHEYSLAVLYAHFRPYRERLSSIDLTRAPSGQTCLGRSGN